MATALFVCLHNAGRSQMSAALFERAAGGPPPRRVRRHDARRARPSGGGRGHAKLGIDLAGRRPRRLTRELAEQADVVITMGCGDECPYIPGKRYVDWELDPKGQPVSRSARRATTSRIASSSSPRSSTEPRRARRRCDALR
jgi:protein-tyrosine-phosphatase